MRISRLILGAAALALLAGCSKHNTTTEPKIHTVNSYVPNANGRVVSQTTFGSSTGHSSVWDLVTDGTSGFYFRGERNDIHGLGQLGASGDLIRFAGTGVFPGATAIVPLSATAVVPNGLIATGAEDTDRDGCSEAGHVYLYASAGALASHVRFASDSSDLWLGRVAVLSDSLVVVVGSERTPHRSNPVVATVALTPDGELVVRHTGVLPSLVNRACYNLVVDPAEPLGPSLGLYMTTGSQNQAGTQVITVHRVTLDFPSLSSFNVEWSRDVSPMGAHSAWPSDLCLYEGHLYLAGYGDDPDCKIPAPANGGQWHSGIAARLTLSGDLEWSKTLRVTGHCERLYQVVPTPGALYMVGVCASYYMGDTNEEYGFGWIAQLDPSTGATLRNLTFGADTYESGVNTAVFSGGTLRCGGWTRCAVPRGPYLGWSCNVDVSGASPAPSTVVTAIRPGSEARASQPQLPGPVAGR